MEVTIKLLESEVEYLGDLLEQHDEINERIKGGAWKEIAKAGKARTLVEQQFIGSLMWRVREAIKEEGNE